MDPTARVSDQVRPSSPSPTMNSSEADPHPAPPAAAAQSAEPGSQGSIPSPQKPNPTIPTPPPRNASAANATAESSRNAPEPTTATAAPSLKAPGVTTAAPCRKSSRAASATAAATAKPSRNTPGPTTATTAPSLKALGVTTAAPSGKASGATSTAAAACLRNPSGATTSAAAVSRIPSAPATTTTNAISGYPSVATAAVAAQNPLGTAAVGSVPRGTAPTRPEDYTPRMGMEFESEQEAYEFYRYYGWMVGFHVRKEYGNRSKKTGEITSRRFSCSREGHRAGAKAASNKRLPMPDSRTGCHAHLIIRRRKQDSKLEVYVFEPRHNHPLFAPSSMPCPFRGMAMPNGVPTPDYLANVGEPSGVQNSTEGGNAVSTRGAPRQPLRTRRQREMRFGEAGALLNYFQERCLAEPSFYHAVQLDADDKMTNTFWADGRMIVDYTQFGDVVAFDMVSRSGTSIRHFASFVGVNNFGEPIIFALALMYDETAESFQWLFETFLHAMSGQSPKTFFSHQDTVITKAVSLVMPKTSHVICAWNLKHAGKRILNQLGKDESDFFKEFKACINEYEEEMEFLTSWNAMINKHNLQDNVWLQQVFEEKEKWARPYVKGTFSAGMKGTQLNEQFHSDVRDHLKAEVDIISFLNNLQKVINDRRYKEMEVEYSSRLKLPFFKIKAPILAQASEAYTSTIFQLFQEEYEEFQSAYIVNRDESGPCRDYTVSIVEKEKQYTVSGNPMEQTVSCSCRKFEARGFLCSHALKVLDAMDIKYLPDRYIMKRWTKYAKRLTSSVVPDQTFQADDSMEFSSCYQHMCKKYVRLVARASECVETYRVLDKFWFELGKKVDDILQKQTSIDASMIQPDVQDLMTSLSSITNGAGQENLREKSSKARTKESKKGQKNKIQPRNCIEKGLRKKQKIHTEQSSMPYPLSNASAQPGNALFQGIALSNPTGPINYEGMHSGLHLSFTPELGFDLSHLSDK